MRTGIATSVDHTQTMTPRFYPMPTIALCQYRNSWNLFITIRSEHIEL